MESADVSNLLEGSGGCAQCTPQHHLNILEIRELMCAGASALGLNYDHGLFFLHFVV